MIAFYFAFIALGAWAILSSDEANERGLLMGIGITGVGVICSGLFASSFYVPRAQWAWNLHLVLIALGVCGVITTPFALVVGIAWFHQDTLDYFGVKRAT
jgi:hypothetical protein